MQIILNFNSRMHNGILYINPDEWIISDKIENNYNFFIDLNQLSPFLKWVSEKDCEKINYNDFVNDLLFYNDGDCWGCNYPMYEVIINKYGKEVSLSPCDFVDIEKPKIDRRHKIEKVIKENVRLETELKGLRKAVLFLINKVSEIYKEDLSKSIELESFINNNTYITNIISQFPKEEPKNNDV